MSTFSLRGIRDPPLCSGADLQVCCAESYPGRGWQQLPHTSAGSTKTFGINSSVIANANTCLA